MAAGIAAGATMTESDGTVGFGDDMPAFMKISVRA